jgi:hypothetical protein
VINDEFGSRLGNNGELLGVGSAEVDSNHHLGIAVLEKAVILDAVNPLAVEFLEC